MHINTAERRTGCLRNHDGKEQDVVFPTKKGIMGIINSVRWKYDKQKIDEIAKERGHTVLQLPLYHCGLNPIEFVWAQVKYYRVGCGKSDQRQLPSNYESRLLHNCSAQYNRHSHISGEAVAPVHQVPLSLIVTSYKQSSVDCSKEGCTPVILLQNHV